VLPRSLTVAGAPERREPGVATSDERAHAELGRQRDGRVVVRRRRLGLGKMAKRDDLSEDTERVRLVAALATLASERESALGIATGVAESVSRKTRLGRVHEHARLPVLESELLACRECLKALRRLGATARQDVRPARSPLDLPGLDPFEPLLRKLHTFAFTGGIEALASRGLTMKDSEVLPW